MFDVRLCILSDMLQLHWAITQSQAGVNVCDASYMTTIPSCDAWSSALRHLVYYWHAFDKSTPNHFKLKICSFIFHKSTSLTITARRMFLPNDERKRMVLLKSYKFPPEKRNCIRIAIVECKTVERKVVIAGNLNWLHLIWTLVIPRMRFDYEKERDDITLLKKLEELESSRPKEVKSNTYFKCKRQQHREHELAVRKKVITNEWSFYKAMCYIGEAFVYPDKLITDSILASNGRMCTKIVRRLFKKTPIMMTAILKRAWPLVLASEYRDIALTKIISTACVKNNLEMAVMFKSTDRIVNLRHVLLINLLSTCDRSGNVVFMRWLLENCDTIVPGKYMIRGIDSQIKKIDSMISSGTTYLVPEVTNLLSKLRCTLQSYTKIRGGEKRED